MIISRWHSALVLCSLVSLVACGQKPDGFHATDITDAGFGKQFELVDHHGQLRHLEDFRGKVIVMFFGFTHCPDVCPTTLAELAAILRNLGDQAQRVQVLFVTVDPERDTSDVLAGYVTAFNSDFIGLTGSLEQIATVAREFKVAYQKAEGSRSGMYSVDHSTGTYIIDAQGRLRLYVRYGQDSEAIASDITRLLGEA
jgi:protein SCO1/2